MSLAEEGERRFRSESKYTVFIEPEIERTTSEQEAKERERKAKYLYTYRRKKQAPSSVIVA